jgi:hypothetical protein
MNELWRVNIKNAKTAIQSTCNNAHDTINQKELINYLHAACFSPVKSTWIAAIKNGNLTSWPGLTERAVEMYLSKSSATVEDYSNQQRMNARSTKIKEEIESVTTDKDLDYGINTNCIYAAKIYAGQIYTDQTGRFPVISSEGNKYIMVLYEYGGNVILAEPIKNRTSAELLRAFKVIEKKLTARGLKIWSRSTGGLLKLLTLSSCNIYLTGTPPRGSHILHFRYPEISSSLSLSIS